MCTVRTFECTDGLNRWTLMPGVLDGRHSAAYAHEIPYSSAFHNRGTSCKSYREGSVGVNNGSGRHRAAAHHLSRTFEVRASAMTSAPFPTSLAFDAVNSTSQSFRKNPSSLNRCCHQRNFIAQGGFGHNDRNNESSPESGVPNRVQTRCNSHITVSRYLPRRC